MIPLQYQVERGIHEQPFHTFDGSLVLVAVNGFGREVGRVAVNRLADYALAQAFLEGLLLLAERGAASVSLEIGQTLPS